MYLIIQLLILLNLARAYELVIAGPDGCSIPVKTNNQINDTLLLIWQDMSCDTPIDPQYKQSFERCNATIEGETSDSLITPGRDASISICPPSVKGMYLYANNTSPTLFGPLADCLVNQTFIQAQCEIQNRRTAVLQQYFLISIGIILACGACVGLAKLVECLSKNHDSSSQSTPATDKTYLLSA